MKKVVLLLLLISVFQLIKAVELEPRMGVSNVHSWGVHMGALVLFPTSNLFAIQTGAQLYTGILVDNNKVWNIGLNIPMYASFRIPVSNSAKIIFNVGPYVGFEPNIGHFGASAETGIEFNRFFVGVGYFKNCINNKEDQLNMSVGYKFTL